MYTNDYYLSQCYVQERFINIKEFDWLILLVTLILKISCELKLGYGRRKLCDNKIDKSKNIDCKWCEIVRAGVIISQCL